MVGNHVQPCRDQKSGQFLVRTHVRRKAQILRNSEGMSGVLKLDADVYLHKPLQPGFYAVRGLYEDAGQPREFYQNGFWVEDEKLLTSGPVLGVNGDFLTRDGKPYFPVGTNYFTTEGNGWDFSGPRNAWVWEKDFSEMARHGVTFVRTGVWMPNSRFVEPSTAAVNERFRRNLEAYLLCARGHNIIVNFTFFAFTPRAGGGPGDQPGAPGLNPYTDPAAIRAEQDHMLSVVNHFKEVSWLCWDLINEPSFSNPNRLWKGNTPNGDPTETAAWHKWLREKYRNLADLAAAWSVTPEQLGSFDGVRFRANRTSPLRAIAMPARYERLTTTCLRRTCSASGSAPW
jgi:hypothetical protein